MSALSPYSVYRFPVCQPTNASFSFMHNHPEDPTFTLSPELPSSHCSHLNPPPFRLLPQLSSQRSGYPHTSKMSNVACLVLTAITPFFAGSRSKSAETDVLPPAHLGSPINLDYSCTTILFSTSRLTSHSAAAQSLFCAN